jgi:hypothetical protein
VKPTAEQVRRFIRLSSYIRDARRLVAKGWQVTVTPSGVTGKFGPAFRQCS